MKRLRKLFEDFWGDILPIQKKVVTLPKRKRNNIIKIEYNSKQTNRTNGKNRNIGRDYAPPVAARQ